MVRSYDVVIVGAGHGGAQAAIALRQHKFEGTIALIGDETDLPYERPPLSKEYLSSEKSFDRLLIRPSAFWDDRNIEMLLGKRLGVPAIEVALEAERTGNQPTHRVEIEGFDGLKQLSSAIEQNKLDFLR